MKSLLVRIRNNKILHAILFAFIPIIVMKVYMISQNVSFSELFLPNTHWNDEGGYFFQIGSMIKYGEPLGYMGYNESFAKISTFGAWTPVIFIPYWGLGKVFGWTYQLSIIFNIFFVFCSYIVMYMVLKPKKESLMLLMCFSLAFLPIYRWTLSCTPEAMFMALMIMYVSVWIRSVLYVDTAIFPLIICNVLAIGLSLMRPTYLVLLIGNMLFVAKDIRRKIIIVVTELTLIFISAVSYFTITHYFCATYFVSQINLTWLKMFKNGLKSGVSNFFAIGKSGIKDVGDNIVAAFVEGRIEGCIYLGLIIVCSLFFILCIIDRKKIKIYIFLLFSHMSLLMANVYLYSVSLGARHLLQWIFVDLIVVSYVLTSDKLEIGVLYRRILQAGMLISVFILFTVMFPKDYYQAELPLYDEPLDRELKSGCSQMENYINNSNSRWDNTVIIPWNCVEKDMYGLPDGTGINMCSDEYVISNKNNLKSKYIMIYKEGYLIDELGLRDEEPVASFDETYVYALRD